VGTIAGCIVREGKIKRGQKVRVIRDGIVIKTAELASLKHIKDDIKEAGYNTECGLSLKSFDDLQTGDMLESFEEIEVAKKLE
jgi:translation initiation factor IF-2